MAGTCLTERIWRTLTQFTVGSGGKALLILFPLFNDARDLVMVLLTLDRILLFLIKTEEEEATFFFLASLTVFLTSADGDVVDVALVPACCCCSKAAFIYPPVAVVVFLHLEEETLQTETFCNFLSEIGVSSCCSRAKLMKTCRQMTMLS